MQTTTVGKFTYDPNTKEIAGPKAYMEAQGFALLDKINRGEHKLLNETAHLSPNPVTAVLVWLQTDYADWLGMKGLEAMMGRND